MSDGQRTDGGVFGDVGGLDVDNFDEPQVDADAMDRMFLALGSNPSDAWQLDELGTDPDFYVHPTVPQLSSLQYIDTDPPATSAPPPTPALPTTVNPSSSNNHTTQNDPSNNALLPPPAPLTAAAAIAAATSANLNGTSPSAPASPSTPVPTIPPNAGAPQATMAEIQSASGALHVPTSATNIAPVPLSTPPRSPNPQTSTLAQNYSYSDRNQPSRRANVSKQPSLSNNTSKSMRGIPRPSKGVTKRSPKLSYLPNKSNNISNSNNTDHNTNLRSPINSSSNGRSRSGSGATVTTIACSSCGNTVSGTTLQLRQHERTCNRKQQHENMSLDGIERAATSSAPPSDGALSDGTHSQPTSSPQAVPTNNGTSGTQQQSHQLHPYQNQSSFQEKQQRFPFLSQGRPGDDVATAIASVAPASASASASASTGLSRRDADLLSVVRRLETTVNTLDINARICLRDALVSLSNKASNPAVPPTPQQEAMNRAAEYLVLRMLFLSGQQVMHTPPGTGAGYSETPIVTASTAPVATQDLNQQQLQHQQNMIDANGETASSPGNSGGTGSRKDDGTIAKSTGQENVSVAQPDEEMVDIALQSTDVRVGDEEDKVEEGT